MEVQYYKVVITAIEQEETISSRSMESRIFFCGRDVVKRIAERRQEREAEAENAK